LCRGCPSLDVVLGCHSDFLATLCEGAVLLLTTGLIRTPGLWSFSWAYKCPKHVEQIISAIKHSVESSWFSSLRLYRDARTNMHQIRPKVFK